MPKSLVVFMLICELKSPLSTIPSIDFCVDFMLNERLLITGTKDKRHKIKEIKKHEMPLPVNALIMSPEKVPFCAFKRMPKGTVSKFTTRK